MNVVRTVETRVARPAYFSGSKDQMVILSVMKGRGYVTTTEKVKIQALANGKYSIRCIGKGGFSKTIHVNPTAYVVMVVKDGADSLAGPVKDIFAYGQN